MVILPRTVQQMEAFPELRVHGAGRVAHDFKPAAMRRSVGREARYDDVASSLDGSPGFCDVGSAVSGIGEKMEDSSIMPHIVHPPWEYRAENIGLEPRNMRRALAQPVLRHSQRGSRNVEHRQVPVIVVKEIIDQRRGTAADINDMRIQTRSDTANEVQRNSVVRLVPADLRGLLRSIYTLPMFAL